MTILDQVKQFSETHGKEIIVNHKTWRYYRLGTGPAILWLTGGLRRAALGYAFMERLSARHTVIAPDYPPVRTIGEFLEAFDAILRAEQIDTFTLGAQSYGGLLAQAYLAQKPGCVEKLVLSSTGPADYGKAWLPVEYLAIGLARLLPEKKVKGLLAAGLLKAITLPEAEREEWEETIHSTMQNELSREDVISHFGVAADLILSSLVRPGAFQTWTGRIIVLAAENDPTQSKKDIPHYEKLFGRPVEVVSMEDMGHTAALFDPHKYVKMIERALE